jgi:ribonuclease Z
VRRRTLFLSIAILLIGTGIAVKSFQAQIGTAIFKRAASARAGTDITVKLPDGLHVGLCGTGSPLPNRDRAGACTLIIAGKHIFVVDAGEGSARNIALMGVPTTRIERLFLTHFHSDHIDGLGPMMLLRWAGSSNTSPLPVHGPEGVDAVMAGFNAAYIADNGYRIAHHGEAIIPPAAAGAVAVPFALTGDSAVIYAADGLKVTAFRVNHAPVAPALGYRFDYQGRSVVISGDTAPTPILINVAKGADLLIHEALQPKLVGLISEALDAKQIKTTAQITRDILDYHTSPEDAAKAAQNAGVSELVLSHIVPAIPSRFFYPAFLGDAQRHFNGPIIIGEDGMLLSLPAGSKAIKKTSLM